MYRTPSTHFRSVSVLKVSTATGPSVRRFFSSRNISSEARRGPFSLLPTGRMECTSSLLSDRLRWVNSERKFIVSGRLLRLLPLRSRLVRAELSPTTLGTCQRANCEGVLAIKNRATLIFSVATCFAVSTQHYGIGLYPTTTTLQYVGSCVSGGCIPVVIFIEVCFLL